MLIAGVGNIFLGDDAFGPEVARRLAAEDLPGWVRVADYGISGMHLAYDLADGYDAAILVDASPRGDKPGTVTVLRLLGDGLAVVDTGQGEEEVSVALVEAQPGDTILVHAKEAIAIVGR